MEVRLRTAKSLVRRLSSAGDDEESVAAAVAEIRLLSKHDPDARLPLADAGAVPLLARRLLSATATTTTSSSSSASIEEDAAAALLNLSISARDALMSSPTLLLDALAAALRSPSTAAPHAAAALFSLLSVDDSHRRAIASNPEILSSLVALLRDPPDPDPSARARAVKDALKALFGIALHPPSRPALISLGVVPALFSVVVEDGRMGLVEDATAVIAQVAGCGEGPAEFRKAGGVRVLVDLVEAGRGTSERARENAAAALLNLVRSGCTLTAEEATEVEERVRALAEGRGSKRGRAKAQALLGALESQRNRFADFGSSDSPPPLSSSSSSAPAAI